MATVEGKAMYAVDRTVLVTCPFSRILALFSAVTPQMTLRMSVACMACKPLSHDPDVRVLVL